MAEALSQFSSPAKRRKLGFACDDAEGGAPAGKEGKAGGSRLKGSKTMTPQKSRAYKEPSTPGSKAQAGMDDGLLSVSPELLPANLMLLNQLLGALYVTMPLVKSRGKPTTYQNLRVPVQNFSGRDFQIRHVQQIKAVCPGALDWEHMLTTNTTTRKQEQQLLIKMPTNTDNPKQSFDTAQMQQTFFKSLQQYAQKHQASSVELQLPMAELPLPAGPNARDCTPSRRGINPYELLPGTPQTAPPPGAMGRTGSSSDAQQSLMMSPPPKRAAATSFKGAAGLMSPYPARTRGVKLRQLGKEDGANDFTFSPAPKGPALDTSKLFSPAEAFSSHQTPVKSAEEGSAVAARTPALRPNKLFGTPLAAATPQQTSTNRPTDRHSTPVAAETRSQAAAGGVKARRLTFDVTATAGTENKKRTKSGLTFELGDSAMALLQQVSDAEVQKENVAQQQGLDQQRALDMLPGSFDVMRSVFGDKGPCVKPRSEVLQLLRQKSTCKSGMSPADASEQLELMLRFIPEFVRTINAAGQSLAGMTQSVRINRQMPWPAVRHKLLGAAAEARSTGVMAAAEAITADELRGHQELEAAEADAAVMREEGGSEDGSVLEEASCIGPSSLDSMLAELGDGGSTSSLAVAKSGSSSAGVGLSDEAVMLLGGGVGNSTKKASHKSADNVSASMLSCLSFKAPAGKVSR